MTMLLVLLVVWLLVVLLLVALLLAVLLLVVMVRGLVPMVWGTVLCVLLFMVLYDVGVVIIQLVRHS